MKRILIVLVTLCSVVSAFAQDLITKKDGTDIKAKITEVNTDNVKKMNLLDAANGELKESIDISGAIMSDPVLSGGKLYFSTLAKEVEEMDLATNERRGLLHGCRLR